MKIKKIKKNFIYQNSKSVTRRIVALFILLVVRLTKKPHARRVWIEIASCVSKNKNPHDIMLIGLATVNKISGGSINGKKNQWRF